MRTIVRGFWGPRPESLDEVADRWLATLTAIDELLPGAGWQHVHASGPPTALPPERAPLLGALRAAEAAEGWSDVIGTGLRLIRTTTAGGEIEVSGLAGGAPEYLLQSLVIGITSPDGVALPEARLLAAVVLAWEPDFGDVTDDDILDALEDDGGFAVDDPAIGRLAYLSARRGARLPDDLGAARREALVGGVVVATSGGPDAVVRVAGLLRDAGVLQPLPRPMDRALW
ncbi:hypothetical protein [Rhodococcus gannanensis]|uniref:Uncharacterized protein n=1 Tax=Rhodococcus gannanensis TaxID=1960308 RepID=A0ABW4P4P8_9NOCA